MNSGRSAWILFDADNTLWDVESLYDKARHAFCAHVEDLLLRTGRDPGIDGALVEMLQRRRDIQLYETHGYSPSRFARSFEDTLLFLLPHSSPDEVRQARRLASDVFAAVSEPTPGLETTLPALEVDYSLAIVTAGDKVVQESRLAAFRYRDRFKRIEVVEQKSEAVLEELCQVWGVDQRRSWFVGDSLRSDIIPATRIGLGAIHFHAPNWAVEHGRRPEGVSVAVTMAEVMALIGAATR